MTATSRCRVGLTVAREAEWQSEAGDTRRTSLHAGADFEHAFRQAQISVGGAVLPSELEPNWGSVRVGGTYQWGDGKYSATGELSAGTGIEDFGASREFQQTLGLAIKW